MRLRHKIIVLITAYIQPRRDRNGQRALTVIRFTNEVGRDALVQFFQEIHQHRQPSPGIAGGPVRGQTLITLMS